MNFSRVYRIVFRKELRELLRDRRSLFWLFAPPILLPLIAICGAVFIGTQAARIAEDGIPVVIENGEQAPELVQRLDENESVNVLEPPPTPEEDPFGDAVLIISIPPDFEQQMADGMTAEIELIPRNSAVVSLLGASVVRSVINGYGDDILDERLADRGLDREWLDPIDITEGRRRTQTDTDAVVALNGDDEEDGGGSLVATIFLPLAVTSWLLGGGLGLILDTTVGEKERQTIENLLVTPANRIGIVLGKLSVVFLASVAVMSLWLTEGIILNAFTTASDQLFEAAGLGDAVSILLDSGGGILGLIGVLVLLIVPFIVMLNGLTMAVCAYAANYREANLFMALIQLGLPATVLITVFSVPADVSTSVYTVPFFGTIVAIRDLFSNALSLTAVFINIASGIAYAAFAIWLAAWMFNKEWSLTRGL
jgi:sodium transport system permease protein